MKVLIKITNIIDKINERVGKFCAFAAVLVMLVMVYEVLSRKIFNAPTIWAFETSTMIYGFLMITIAGYGLLTKSIVSVDIFSAKLSEKNQHKLSICMYLLFFFPFVTLMLQPAFQFAVNSWSIRELSWSQWAPPVYPIKTFLPIGLFLLWLQGISELLKSVIYLLEHKGVKSVEVREGTR